MKIQLTGEELAQAIYEYLDKRGLNFPGSQQIVSVNGEACTEATVIYDNSKTYAWNGTGFVAQDALARG